jgi:hypothetical protein
MTRLDKKKSSPRPDSTELHPDVELKDELIANLRRIEQKVINGELPEQALQVIMKSLEIEGIAENLPHLAKLIRDHAESAEDLYSFGSDSPDSTSTVPDFNNGA